MINKTLTNLLQSKNQDELEELSIVCRYLQQNPSNTVQYLYTASDGSLLEVDIYVVEDIPRKSVFFATFEQFKDFPKEVTLSDLEQAIKRSKLQSPLRYKGICATRWEEIKFLVGGE